MSGQETIANKLEVAQLYLNDINNHLTFHIEEDHRGTPPSTCHRCLNFRQQRQFAIEDVDKFKILINKPSVGQIG